MAWAFQPEYYSKRFRRVPVDERDRLKALIVEKCVIHGDFVLASGQRSKVFFDCKRVTLDPEGIHLIAGLLLDLIDDLARRDGRPIDAIGGPTIGADPVVGHVAGRSWERAHRGAAPAAYSVPAASAPVATAPVPESGDVGPAATASHPAPPMRPLRAFL